MTGKSSVRLGVLSAGLALVAGVAAIPVVAAEAKPQFASGVENQPTRPEVTGVELLQPENGTIRRYEDRVELEIRMPTPLPGSYNYPEDVPPLRQASPEVFTAWAFVFNHPEQCTAEGPPQCGPDDFTDAARGGVYNLAGHITSVDHEGGAFVLNRESDGDMVIRGTIHVGDAPRRDLPPSADTPRFGLENPLGAEVHVAIAPHGQLVPETLPGELFEPDGSPGCTCWWVAFFEAP